MFLSNLDQSYDGGTYFFIYFSAFPFNLLFSYVFSFVNVKVCEIEVYKKECGRRRLEVCIYFVCPSPKAEKQMLQFFGDTSPIFVRGKNSAVVVLCE